MKLWSLAKSVFALTVLLPVILVVGVLGLICWASMSLWDRVRFPAILLLILLSGCAMTPEQRLGMGAALQNWSCQNAATWNRVAAEQAYINNYWQRQNYYQQQNFLLQQQNMILQQRGCK